MIYENQLTSKTTNYRKRTSSYMRPAILFIIALFAFTSACSNVPDPEKFLIEAKETFYENDSFDFTTLAMYPSPTGSIDTSYFYLSVEKEDSSLIGYDYIAKKERIGRKSDVLYLDGDYKAVDHIGKLVQFYPKDEEEREQSSIINDLAVKYSPMLMFSYTDWNFVADTVLKGQSYKNYLRVERNKVGTTGIQILTEQHIFINTESKLIERFERRNYNDGVLSQLVAYEFYDYEVRSASEPLSYQYPENYSTSLLGTSPYENNLEVGQKAPEFIAVDEQGNQIKLADYRGKKVLLNFSIINCGYCIQSIKHFNRQDYEISENVVPIYINPVDNSSDMSEFDKKFNVPFPVIVSNAQEISELYGVISYPLFYLIDEKGTIEKVINGYDEEFQESLKS